MESKHYVRRGKNYKKKVCKSLREHAIKAINFKKKKMKLLTNKQYKSYENATACYICSEKFEDKNIVKLEIIVIIQVNTAHIECNLK